MKKFRLLSIDGGGIRGIIPAMIIVELEKRLNNKSGTGGKRIGDYFDMIAGTSTGGILTCIYLCPDKSAISKHKPLFSAKDAVDLYIKNGKKIFNEPFVDRIFNPGGIAGPKYDEDGAESTFFKYFENIKLSELIKPTIITSYNIEKRYAHFFTQQEAKINPDYDFYLRDVARATSAAPTFFRPAVIKSIEDELSEENNVYPLVDGGVFANNPSMCAYTELYREFEIEPENMVIISLGTGKLVQPIDYKSAKDWGAPLWALPLLDITLNAGSDVVDYQLETIFKSIKKEENYVRINPELTDSDFVAMDNASDENVNALIKFSESVILEFDEKIEKMVELLLSE